ncbi:FAD-dependent oxidoreductase [Nocardia sp. KC 131]|uniref:FAD-dependent oxidoreductase n=1 Tax=Nocardia arseniciresistens TaxID=3392119 RepID=UPI00398E65E0
MPADEETYDIVVVGSGGGGLIGAYVAASRGLRTLVIEKTGLVGGTTAYSGAGIWFPGSAPLERAGIQDGIEGSRTYLRSIVDDSSRESLQDAYLRAGPQLIDELEQNPLFDSFFYAPVPEYFASAPGASPAGHSIFPAAVSVDELGELASIVRRSIPEERWGNDEGHMLYGGRALIGRALKAFVETGNGSYRLDTALENLMVEDGRVVGLEAVSNGERVTIRAARGVLLAAGGFEQSSELREQNGVVPAATAWSHGAPENTGDAIQAGAAIGAATNLLDEAWHVPGLIQPDGRPVFFTGARGGIWVNAAGERFMNEIQPYDRAGHEMRRLHTTTGVDHSRVHWVFDQRLVDRDSFGGDPAEPVRPEWFESGALKKADTLEELAELIGVPVESLRKSVEEFNGYAHSGVDERFHRGETPWDQMFHHVVGFSYEPGNPTSGTTLNYLVPLTGEWPNPLVQPIEQGPFYAATIVLSDIGTKGGLKTDDHARVMRADGQPIEGLYAAGNTMSAMSGRVYAGAGTPIGSSLAFAYLAVLDIVGKGE